MKNKSQLLLWIIGFLLLDLYFQGIPRLVTLDALPWLTYAVVFFIVAHLFAKYILRLKGLSGFGLQLQNGWAKWLLLGFLIGFAVWALKYALFYQMGKFEVTGTMDTGFIVNLVVQALVGMLLASAMNDVITRGYLLAFCKRTNLMHWFILISTVLYALEDSWNEGVNITNLVFSAVLGISLAYTVIKTGTIWMAVGIHWGLNVMYRLLFGFNGQGAWKVEQVQESAFYDWISILITALIFPVVYLLLRNTKAMEEQKEIQTAPASELMV